MKYLLDCETLSLKNSRLVMKFRDLLVLGIFFVCVLQPHHAYARGPSTPEERAKVVQLTRALERKPLAENAAANRQWSRRSDVACGSRLPTWSGKLTRF